MAADRDAEDWQKLRDALYGEVPKGDADRAVERLRHALQDLPASRWLAPLRPPTRPDGQGCRRLFFSGPGTNASLRLHASRAPLAG
jgi:hypothetical protein